MVPPERDATPTCLENREEQRRREEEGTKHHISRINTKPLAHLLKKESNHNGQRQIYCCEARTKNVSKEKNVWHNAY